jgi:hypothetical protein
MMARVSQDKCDESGARWDESGARWDESGALGRIGGHGTDRRVPVGPISATV